MNKILQADMIVSESLVINQDEYYTASKKNAKIIGPVISDNLADFLITSLDYGIDAMELEDLC